MKDDGLMSAIRLSVNSYRHGQKTARRINSKKCIPFGCPSAAFTRVGCKPARRITCEFIEGLRQTDECMKYILFVCPSKMLWGRIGWKTARQTLHLWFIEVQRQTDEFDEMYYIPLSVGNIGKGREEDSQTILSVNGQCQCYPPCMHGILLRHL